MTKLPLKDIVTYIKKNAVKFTALPAVTSPGINSGANVSEVKAMQEQLIKLAQSVITQLNLQEVSATDPMQDKRKQQEAMSRHSFGTFITKNYLRDSDVPGKEFDPNPKKTKLKDKSSSIPTHLSVVMDTMMRIGSPEPGENFADGDWGFRTNASLHNAYAFAQGMLKLANEFKLRVTYNQEELSKFAPLIPEDDEAAKALSLEEKTNLAKQIIVHLKSIQKMYQEIRQGILERPEYQTFIEGDKPFISYKKGIVLTPEQLSSLQATFPSWNIKLKDGSIKPIAVKDLLSVTAFKNWQSQNASDLPANIILSQIKTQLTAGGQSA